MFHTRNAGLLAFALRGLAAAHDPEGLRGPSGPLLTTRELQERENANEKCFAPDCELRTGEYEMPSGEIGKWWAFVPAGENACPDEGCPLFVAIDGTGDEFFDPPDQQTWMYEMVKRGFVGVTMEYANGFSEFGLCYHTQDWSLSSLPSWVGADGLTQKAQAILDPRDPGSVISQVCDGPDAFANCDLGIAVQGVSQGSLVLAQGTNFEKRISAALLWAVGDVVQVIRSKVPFALSSVGSAIGIGEDVTDVDLPCMDALQLPPARMRLINGDSDRYFGRNAEGTIVQHKHMFDGYYDCGDDRDCLTPQTGEVPDTYTGGLIPNEGGYYIVDDSTHTSFFRCIPDCGDDCTDEDYLDCDEPSPIFENDAIYGGPAGYDWLARTARNPWVPQPGSDFDAVTMELDLAHWRLIDTGAVTGFFVEWAAGDGSLGKRERVAEGSVYQMHRDYTGAEVPADTVGFRLHAAGNDGAFLDQVHVTFADGDIFNGLTFGENNRDGWCLSMDPNDTFFFVDCHGDQAYRCIDFCTDGSFHVCSDNELSECVGSEASASVVASE